MHMINPGLPRQVFSRWGIRLSVIRAVSRFEPDGEAPPLIPPSRERRQRVSVTKPNMRECTYITNMEQGMLKIDLS